MTGPFAMPELLAADTHCGPVPVRYEDIAQDGRVIPIALAHSFGDVLWPKLLNDHPATKAASAGGVIPILTKLSICGGDGPVPATRALSARGGVAFAHTRDSAGAVDRILLRMWTEVTGTEGRTHQPAAADAREITVGHVYGEHVLTRLFAPPGQRKVTELALPGMPAVPPTEHPWSPPSALLELPDGAKALEPDLAPDAAPVVFGLGHTDSNQHVNSLVYPRLFEEAVLRRLVALGRSPRVLTRQIDIAYRKPCFAGDTMRIVLRLFALGDQIGATGAFLPDDPDANPHVCLRLLFGDDSAKSPRST